MKTYKAYIFTKKQDSNSFLVALIPALRIPTEFKENKDVYITDLAVIAANHESEENDVWAYVHLERDEKQAIGDALVSTCAVINQWYWCNLYVELC